MEWAFCLAAAVVSAGLGFAGGRVALLTDRRRRAVEPEEPAGESAFRLEHADGLTWALINIGTAPAALVRLIPFADGIEHWPPQPVAGHIETATSGLLPTLQPSESMGVWFSRYDPGQQVIVSWTSERNVRMGPVRLDVPAPE